MKANRKRSIGWMLAAMLFVPTTVYASDGATIRFTYPTDVAVGDTFEVVATMERNPGFSAMQMTLSFDETVLECTNIEQGPLMDGMLSAKNPNAETGAIVVGATVSNVAADGELAVFTFEVLAPAQDQGAYNFEVRDTHYADLDGNTIEVDFIGAHEVTEAPTEELGTQDPPTDTTTPTVAPTTDTETTEPPQHPEPHPPADASGGAQDPSEARDDAQQTSTEEQEPPAIVFTDIAEHWAEEAIEQAAQAELVAGYGDGIYAPNDLMTRAQMLSVLWRNAGSPAPNAPSTFTDLEADQTWYHDAIAWAEEAGLVYGYGDGRVGPTDAVTREQLAAILHRQSGGAVGAEALVYGIYSDTFSDAATLTEGLRASVYWAIYHGVWCGRDAVAVGETLYPAEAVTRAQMAQMFVGYRDFEEGETV